MHTYSAQSRLAGYKNPWILIPP